MRLTEEQNKYVIEHLRNPQKTLSIAAIARMLTQNNTDMHLDSEEVEMAALLMNIGETSEYMIIDGENIYDHAGGWTPEMREKNAERGQRSIEMAESQGIALSDMSKEAIISTSKGGTLNKIGITLKVAQTMEAVKYKRYTKEGPKEPAKNITEVTEIINSELDFMLRGQAISEDTKEQIKNSMIAAARKTYVMEKSNDIRSIVHYVTYEAEKQISMYDSVSSHIGESTLTDSVISDFLKRIPEDKIDDIYSEVHEAFSDNNTPITCIESNIGDIISKWENKYKKDINIDDDPIV